MSKEERNKRAKKKRKEDPNPDRKGKAKMVREEYPTQGTKYDGKFDKAFEKAVERTGGKKEDIHKFKSQFQKAHFEPEGEVVSEKKDACYKKVKSRYKIWPSAYASGALSKCRKVGAANWGNSTKKEGYEFSNWRDDFQPIEIETTDLITPDPIQVPSSNLQKIEEKCWVGYKQLGMKKKGKKMVPNCVKEGYSNWREELSEEGVDILKDKGRGSEPKSTKPEYKNPYGLKGIGPGIRDLIQKAHFEPEGELIEGAAWTKKSGKNPKGGLNEKGRKSYERENPGSDLKAPSKEKGNKRRKSFCARMKGMKKKLTSKKTANDPDSRINKSLRAWNC
jgi:hypothetical protein